MYFGKSNLKWKSNFDACCDFFLISKNITHTHAPSKKAQSNTNKDKPENKQKTKDPKRDNNTRTGSKKTQTIQPKNQRTTLQTPPKKSHTNKPQHQENTIKNPQKRSHQENNPQKNHTNKTPSKPQGLRPQNPPCPKKTPTDEAVERGNRKLVMQLLKLGARLSADRHLGGGATGEGYLVLFKVMFLFGPYFLVFGDAGKNLVLFFWWFFCFCGFLWYFSRVL